MNRWICLDLYHFEWTWNFQKWKKLIVHGISKDLAKLNITLLDVGGGENVYRMDLLHKKSGDFYGTLLYCYNLHFMEPYCITYFKDGLRPEGTLSPYLPKNYFYSNGSKPRPYGIMCGWD